MAIVATYPPVGDRERDDALRRITLQLDRFDDSRRSEAGSEAREVLSYVRSRHAALPRALTSAIASDQLVLSAWVYWDERRRERDLLKRVLRDGKSLAEVGAFLGIRTRQGMRDYLDRLDALLAEHHRSTMATPSPATGDGATDPLQRYGARTRAERGADVHSTRAGRANARQKPTRLAWIERHQDLICAAVRDLLAQCARLGLHPYSGEDDELPELGDYLAWLEEDLERGDFDHGSFGSLGLALGDLRGQAAVTGLAPNHGLPQAIRRADQLRADYADLTRERPVASASKLNEARQQSVAPTVATGRWVPARNRRS